MSKIIKSRVIKDRLKDNQVLMVGGFLECGVPAKIIDVVLESGVKDLTLIANDTGFTEKKLGSLIANKRVKKVITSHIGTNSETGKQMNNGELEVELIPQGSLAEKIRSQGAGLGGVLTPTGVGTVVEEGKPKLEVKGKDYLLETPLRADIALIKAWKADEMGNLVYKYSARNFNPLMAMAADLVIVEADEIVNADYLDTNQIMTSRIFVDYIVDFS